MIVRWLFYFVCVLHYTVGPFVDLRYTDNSSRAVFESTICLIILEISITISDI